jgi:hypothetical protein
MIGQNITENPRSPAIIVLIIGAMSGFIVGIIGGVLLGMSI